MKHQAIGLRPLQLLMKTARHLPGLATDAMQVSLNKVTHRAKEQKCE